MKKILSILTLQPTIDKMHREQKRIVLAGGCFDILHKGHLIFLEKAKKQGDILIVYVEHDKGIRKTKGDNRPINTQKDRAYMLASLSVIDYVLPLPYFTKNEQYDKLAQLISPSIIATTRNDPNIIHKQRQAKLVGGKIAYVTSRINHYATTYIEKALLN